MKIKKMALYEDNRTHKEINKKCVTKLHGDYRLKACCDTLVRIIYCWHHYRRMIDINI